MALIARFGASPELAPLPDWRFGRPRSKDLAYRLRFGLWVPARIAGSRWRVVSPWLCGTCVELVLSSDLGKAVFVSRCYEPNEMYALSRLLGPGCVFVDVGANIGLYSVVASTIVGAEGRVLAVEPSARERELLERNIALNGLSNVVVDQHALSDVESGSRALHVTDRRHSGQNTFGAVVYEDTTVERDEQVPVTTLDRLLQSHGITKVDVVKIDVEGAEVTVLAGSRRTLSEARPTLMMELQEPSLRAQGAAASDVVSALERAGYDVYSYDRHGSANGSNVPGSPPPLSALLCPLRSDDLTRSQDVVAVPRESHARLER